MNRQVHHRTSHPRYAGAALSGAIFVLLLNLSASASCAQAQWTVAQAASAQAVTGLDSPRTGLANTSSTPSSKSATTAKSAWKDLTPAQQQALQPLAERWGSLGVENKRKWLALSRNYPSLPPAEQAKLHSRMSEWVSLSQQQRTQARLNFAETKKLTPEQKAEQWQAYQALSPEEKKKLAAKAPSKPAGVAIAKPASPQKLADVPVTRHAPIKGARLAAAKYPVQQNTLLPQPPTPQAETEPSPAQPSHSE
jgi:hypothetical protein